MDSLSTDLKKIPIAPNAAISATRNKIALKPGCSLMDWVRLTRSGKDLTGTGGKILEISSRELSKHNSRKDAWTCIRGKVYNITPYIDFHPGGEDELMRGAGKDATDIFNEVHQWVNVESMLRQCFVGILKKSWAFEVPKYKFHRSLKSKNKMIGNGSENGSKDNTGDSKMEVVPGEQLTEYNKEGLTFSSLKSCPDALDGAGDTGESHLKSEWSLTPFSEPNCDTSLRFSGDKEYLKLHITSSTIVQQGLIVDLVKQKLFIKICDTPCCILNIELPAPYENDYVVDHKEDNAIDIFLKADIRKTCNFDNIALASSLQETSWKLWESKKCSSYWSCKLVRKTAVNHNTFLFTYQLPFGTRMWVPIGRHLHIKSYIDGKEIVRSYTPVISSLKDKEQRSEGSEVILMIKIYPKGTMTNIINQCSLGECMLISNYLGSFSEDLLKNCDFAIMLAAGTGITPMIRMIHWIINATDKKRPMLLMFFNKTEEDILWREELEVCKLNYESFNIIHVLSEPSDSWDGPTGQLSEELLSYLPSENFPDTNIQTFICGPLPFIDAALRLLSTAGYNDDSIYAFTGS